MPLFGSIPANQNVEVDPVYVGPTAPPTPDSGDLWWDTDEPVTHAGEELAYNQITVGVTVATTAEAGPTLVIEGTSRTYDGSPIIVDCYLPSVYLSNATGVVFNLWDGSTDLGRVSGFIGGVGYMTHLNTRRRLTPTVGTHNYRLVAWIATGTSATVNVGSGAGAYNPGSVRVTRA